MKLANRIGAAVLATAMVGTLLTGCGGGSASTTASTGDATGAASSTESSGDGDNTYTMFMRSTYVDWIKELKWYDVAEERTGIHVDYISGPTTSLVLKNSMMSTLRSTSVLSAAICPMLL